MTFDINMITCT